MPTKPRVVLFGTTSPVVLWSELKLAVMTVWAGTVRADESTETRLREALRQAITQQRALEDSQAQLQARVSEQDKLVVARARKIEKFMSQPMFVAAQFTGLDGKYVKIEDNIRGFKEIVEGRHDDVPEQAFYMVGTIEEAFEAAKKLQ